MTETTVISVPVQGPRGPQGTKGDIGSRGPQGIVGPPGNAGPAGPTYACSSTSTITVSSSSSRAFSVPSGLAYLFGARVRITETGGTAFMEGIVQSYDGSSLVVTMDYASGVGTFSNWAINVTGITGSQGPSGAAAFKATSTTSLVTGTGSKTFTTQAGLAYSVGTRTRAYSAGTSEWMEGPVTSYSGTSLVINMDLNSGTGTHTDWNINVAGERGAQGPAAGGTMASQNANAVAITGGTITGMGTPSVGGDVTNKTYVDSQVSGAPRSGSINTLRNTSLVSWYHGSSGVITTTGDWTAEGIFAIPTGASIAWARSTNVPAGCLTDHSLVLTGATSVTGLKIRFVIESLVAARIAGKRCTFQLLILNGTGGSITPQIATKYPTVSDDWTSSTADLAAVNMQAVGSATSGTLAYTFDVHANAVFGYEVIIDFGNNFSTSGKSVTIAGGFDLRSTPGTSIGLNASPPLSEVAHPSADHATNQRYFYSSYDNGTAPGTVVAYVRDWFGNCIWLSPTWYGSGGVKRFAVPMRAAPTLVSYSKEGTPGNGNTIWNGSIVPFTLGGTWNVSSDGYHYVLGGADAVQGGVIVGNITADATLKGAA